MLAPPPTFVQLDEPSRAVQATNLANLLSPRNILYENIEKAGVWLVDNSGNIRNTATGRSYSYPGSTTSNPSGGFASGFAQGIAQV